MYCCGLLRIPIVFLLLIVVACLAGISHAGILRCLRCKTVKYVSDYAQPGAQRKVYLDKDFDAGQYSKRVYSGFDNAERKAAIKYYDFSMAANTEQEYRNSQQIFRKIKQVFDGDNRAQTPVVELYDSGFVRNDNRMAVQIVELASGGTLLDRIYTKRTDYTDHTIRELVRQIVTPLNALHQVALHLDVKPGNMVFVGKTSAAQQQLKFIDIDGGFLIPEEDRTDANAEYVTKLPGGTEQYAAPEQLDISTDGRGEMQATVSRKTDVWSIAMILYEILLLQPKYHLDKNVVKRTLTRIAHIYYQGIFMFNKQHETPIEPLKYYARVLFAEEEYTAALKRMLQIWQDFPQTFKLLTNLLNPAHRERMSVAEILEWADGKCVPQMQQLNAARRFSIRIFHEQYTFGHLVFDALRSSLRDQITGVRDILFDPENSSGNLPVCKSQ